jgi:pyruvate dehydrogenase E1 component
MPAGAEEGIVKGMYLLKGAPAEAKGHRVQLIGCGAILREVMAGAELLEKDFGIHADIWSVTSFTELAREAQECERWNLLHPLEQPRVPYITSQLASRGEAPVIASTDYMKLFAEQIRPFAGRNIYRVLGTDGFGRSDYRRKLRSHFEVDRHFVAASALKALADENKVPSTKVAEALAKYGINPEKSDPAKA